MDFFCTGLAGRKISHGRYGVAEAGEILRLVRRPARRSRGHHAGRGEILELTPIVLRKRDTNNRELRRVPSVSNDAMLAASLFPAESGGTICGPLGEENAAIAAQYGDERHSVIAGFFAHTQTLSSDGRDLLSQYAQSHPSKPLRPRLWIRLRLSRRPLRLSVPPCRRIA